VSIVSGFIPYGADSMGLFFRKKFYTQTQKKHLPFIRSHYKKPPKVVSLFKESEYAFFIRTKYIRIKGFRYSKIKNIIRPCPGDMFNTVPDRIRLGSVRQGNPGHDHYHTEFGQTQYKRYTIRKIYFYS